jgi:glycosyltransferase involved in cell wall biosynthesis
VRQAKVGIVSVLDDSYGRLLLPTKLLEYARFGIPAACSRLPVIEQYFPDNSLAYFRPGESAELAAQIDALLRDPGRAASQALQAQRVAQRLGWEQIRGEYLKALGLMEHTRPAASMASPGQHPSE